MDDDLEPSDPDRPLSTQRSDAPPSQTLDLYSFPRRFDLASMMVVSAAYGLLFASMRFYDAGIPLVSVTGGLFAVVGIGQAVLHKGENPRVASFQVGGVYCALAWLIAGLVRGFSHTDFCFAAGFGLFFGPVLGYLAGACVGGVFLIADYLRKGAARVKRLLRRN